MRRPTARSSSWTTPRRQARAAASPSNLPVFRYCGWRVKAALRGRPTPAFGPATARSSSCSTTTPRYSRAGRTPHCAFADPAVGAVAPLVLAWPDGKVIDSAGDRYFVGGVAGKRGHGEPLTDAFLQPCPVFGASASSGFYRRSALDRVGLFPESFGSYFEDVDLAFRLHRAGYQALYEPASRVLHHISASYGRRGRRLLERQSCNEERVFWRNLPIGALPCALPMHAAVLAAKAWRRWQEGTFTPWLLGRLRVLGEIAELMRHRRGLRDDRERGGKRLAGGIAALGRLTRRSGLTRCS